MYFLQDQWYLETPICGLTTTWWCLYTSYVKPKPAYDPVSFSLLSMYNAMTTWLHFYNLKLDIFNTMSLVAVYHVPCTGGYPRVQNDTLVQNQFQVFWFLLMCFSAVNFFLASLVPPLALNLPIASQLGSD